MKNYLDLIPVSARIHRRQSRMTRLCIALSAFLIASIFGMADMEIRAQRYQSIQTDGAWHATFKELTEEQAAILSARPEVKQSARYAVTNYRVDMEYLIEGKETAICGFDESFLALYPAIQFSGRFPQTENEAVITQNAAKRLGIKPGDAVNLETPDGNISFTVSGIAADTSMLLTADAYGLFLNMEGYETYFNDTTLGEDFVCYVQFTPFCNIQKTIADICNQLGIEKGNVGQNAKLLMLMLQTTDSSLVMMYLTAVVLAVLVMIAGILMISGSLNSSVAQRTQFFGMLRCLGATPPQIIRFVRLESLSWCKTALPAGLAASVLTIWALSALLRYLSPSYFTGMPAFGISWVGLAAGGLIGLVTVLLAARSPARNAARVSPLTAVSGNAGTLFPVRRAAHTRLFPVSAALGVHHATGSKKNLILLTCSFSFSIILFLAFFSMVDFMHQAFRPIRPYSPDVSIVSPDKSCSLPSSLAEELSARDFVRKVYGRSFSYDLPAQFSGQDAVFNLISYESNQFNWAKKSLLEGSLKEAMEGTGILVVYDSSLALHPGDLLSLNTPSGQKQLKVAGILSDSPIPPDSGVGTAICSESLFYDLTGQSDYTIIDIQLNRGADDADVESLYQLAGSEMIFSDQRMKNAETKGVYFSAALFIYGFLAVITLISIFNIINSISMSVSARMQQYGAMRAIGMSSRQLVYMVSAEAVTYTLVSILLGCGAGLLVNRQLYIWLVTSRWGISWYVPFSAMGVIVLVMIFSTVLAILGPAGMIRKLSIVDTINAQ